MNDMKCPFCNLDIRSHRIFLDGCDNTHCPLWRELIRTRKALDIALDAIDKGEAALIGCQEADDKYISDVTAEDGLELMSKAHKQITALKQKD